MAKNASPISPAAEKISDAATLLLYPILSTYLAQKRSTRSCVKKNAVEKKLSFQVKSDTSDREKILPIEHSTAGFFLTIDVSFSLLYNERKKCQEENKKGRYKYAFF